MDFGSPVTNQYPDYFVGLSADQSCSSSSSSSPDFWDPSFQYNASSPSQLGNYCNSYPHYSHEDVKPVLRPVNEKMTFPLPRVGVVKRRTTANKKERRRTVSINGAFSELRGRIPHVPMDTKLSKIKTLKLATTYISYLMDALNSDSTNEVLEGGFQNIMKRTLETRDERRKKEPALSTTNGKKQSGGRNRTGWPQQIWALELEQKRPVEKS